MPVNVLNKEARPRTFRPKGGAAFVLMPGVTTAVEDDVWAEFTKTKVKVNGKPVSLLELLEEQGLIEVQGREGKAKKAAATTSHPAPSGGTYLGEKK